MSFPLLDRFKYYYFLALPWLGLLALAFSSPTQRHLLLMAWGGWLTVVLYFYLVVERYRPVNQPVVPVWRQLSVLSGPMLLVIHNLLLADGSWKLFLIEDNIVEVSSIGFVLVVAALRRGWQTRGTADFEGFWFGITVLGVLGGGSAYCFLAPLWEIWWQTTHDALPLHHLLFVGAFVSQIVADGLAFETTLSPNNDSRIIPVLIAWMVLGNTLAALLATS